MVAETATSSIMHRIVIVIYAGLYTVVRWEQKQLTVLSLQSPILNRVGHPIGDDNVLVLGSFVSDAARPPTEKSLSPAPSSAPSRRRP